MARPDDRYSDRYDDDDRGGYGDRDRGRRRDDDDDYEPRRFRKEDVPNYLVPGILVTLFCCLIGGIITIVYAAQANTKAAAGDYQGAMQAANTAKTWMWVSIILGGIVTVAYVALNVAAVSHQPGGRF
jgi:hypothetical protein